MCMFNKPDTPDPQLPPEYAAMREPDQGAVRSSVASKTKDKLRSGANTILTSGSGVTTAAPTDKKTLLGQ
ncbi:hypothetical protein RFN29_15120 [Mesorhizobium sp. VK22B]|uniref:Uncharacterized protein n=3 Tax=Mesorhizobium TaxID=68287 RepID=A0ABU4Z2T6_9HYPH|nr:hypothetical protein [Mesorhizobium abyssinicae]MDX8492908.1 hypothetical protein [Mesorhizobium sp. VK22B]MDX8537055.1 hypothetical protein [Mesorhizobium abyssinicae]